MKKSTVNFMLVTLLLTVTSVRCSPSSGILQPPDRDKMLKGTLKGPFNLLAPPKKNTDQLTMLMKVPIVLGKTDAGSLTVSGLRSPGDKPRGVRQW